MRQAVVNVGSDILGDRGFQFDVFREAGVLDTEVLSCEGPRGVLRVHVEEPIEETRLDAMDAIQWWEHVSSGDSAHVYLIEAGAVDAVEEPARGDARFPRCEQLRVTEDGLTLTWSGPDDRLHEELADLDAAGDDVSLEALRGYRSGAAPLDALTERQRDVLETAFERGYYDVPRSASVREVAAEFDLDDSTVAEHLQRAERNLLRTLFGSP